MLSKSIIKPSTYDRGTEKWKREWDLFSIRNRNFVRELRVIFLKFPRWKTNPRRYTNYLRNMDMIQKKKKKIEFILRFMEFPLYPRTDSVWRRKRFVHFVEKSIKCSFVIHRTKWDKGVDAKSTLNSSSSF